MSKQVDKIYTEICSAIKLTAKEKRLYRYLLEWAASKDCKNPTIGEACKVLHTTVRTYFKTFASLKTKGLTP